VLVAVKKGKFHQRGQRVEPLFQPTPSR
jgi:hypothetical protein